MRVSRLGSDLVAVLRGAAPRWRDLRSYSPMLKYGTTISGLILWACTRAADRVMLIDAGGVVTGDQLRSGVWTLADHLRRQLRSQGIGAAGRITVGIHATSTRHTVAALGAAGVLGVDAVLLPQRMGRADREAIVSEHSIALVLTPEHTAEAFARPLQTQPRPPAPRRTARVHLATSGTTGRPSVVARRGVGPGYAPTALSLIAALDLRRDEPIALFPPLGHGHGLSLLIAALAIGAPAVLCHELGTERRSDLLRDHQPGVLAAVPAQLSTLVHTLGSDITFRRICAGSAPLLPTLATQIQERWGPVLVDFYGSTETGTATIALPEDSAVAPGTVGRVANGVGVQIEADDGTALPTGATGHVVITSAWTSGVPTRTGDRGHLDSSGRLFLQGRSDDVVVIGGHNVHLGAVESWLQNQPEVHRAAVSVHTDARMGAVLSAEVSGADLDLTELRRRAREHLGRSAAPHRIVEVGKDAPVPDASQ